MSEEDPVDKNRNSITTLAVSLASGLGFIAGMFIFNSNLLAGIGIGLAVGIISTLLILIKPGGV